MKPHIIKNLKNWRWWVMFLFYFPIVVPFCAVQPLASIVLTLTERLHKFIFNEYDVFFKKVLFVKTVCDWVDRGGE